MTYNILFNPNPLWKGKTEYYRYTLHRARIEDAQDGSYTDGYVLRYENGGESDIVEGYSEYYIEPGNGFSAELIQEAWVTRRPLPHAARRDVERFAESFATLCESEGTPLVESETLL